MRNRTAAAVCLGVAGAWGLLAGRAFGHHPDQKPPQDELKLRESGTALHDAALRAKRAHAGRNVFRFGRPRDGRLSWSLMRSEWKRLWIELHPGPEREHRRRARIAARPKYPAGTNAHLARIAQCESGGNPRAISPGGTYRGKYQFDYQTWASVGGSGDPAAASEAEQDYRAQLLYNRRGSQPWPVCQYR